MGNDNILIIVVLAVVAYLVIAKKGLANIFDFDFPGIFGTPPPRSTIYEQTTPFVAICPSNPNLLYGDRNCKENPYREADPTQVTATGYPLTQEAAAKQESEYYFDIATGRFMRR